MKKIKTTILSLLLGGLVGAFLGYTVLAFIPKEKLLISLIILVLSIFFTSLIGVIIHEGGHLIMGLITGYQFISFRIGKRILLKQDEHFVLKKYDIAGTGGQCLLMPPAYNQNFPYFWYNFGGGLFNLLAAATAYFALHNFKNNYFLMIILYTFVFINIFFAFSNLIPMKLSVPNDGYNIYMMFKDKSSRYGLYSQMMIYGATTKNIRYQDIDPDLFKLPEQADLNNPLNQSILVNQVARFHDQHKFTEARQLIEKINQNCQLIEILRNELDCEYLFYLIYEDPNNSQIGDLYQKISKYINLTAKTSLERQRLLYAYKLLIEKDEVKAQLQLKQFEKIVITYPYKVTIACEREIIKMIQDKYVNIQD